MAEENSMAGPDGGEEGRKLAKHWIDQLDGIEQDQEYKRWLKRSEAIEKRYRDDRSRDEGQKKYNSLWANVQVLKPALYSKCPIPVAERMFKDKDPVGRGAAQILERALRNEIEICGFDAALSHAVSDYLLPGRGTVWVRYEPEISASISLPPEGAIDLPNDDEENDATGDTEKQAGIEGDDNSPADEKLRSTGDRVTRESTPVDFVGWRDFFTFPKNARVWAEVTAVGKRVYMSRTQMKRRFGSKIARDIPLEKDQRGEKTYRQSSNYNNDDKAQVFEIWSRDDTRIYWVSRGYEYLADCVDDPLALENFFPCPKPIFANSTNNTLVPVPDYIQYQDQATQVDALSQRIAMLTKACKVAGVYNSAAKDIERLFNEATENQLIPVDAWAAFAEQGGVEGNISLLPVKDIIGVLTELQQCKAVQIEEMNQLTGINDIMRGTSDARETLGGVRLKNNATGTRLQQRQNDIAQFARDTVKIMADVMSRHFSPQSLIAASGALYQAGLGPDDMPPLSALMQGGPAPAPGGMLPPPARPPAAPGAPGLPSQAPPGALPAPPTGQNVVPFKPPGLPAPSPPQGMPAGGPAQPMGAPEPQVPPELAAKFAALQRIAKSIELLRDESLRGFRVDIEVDSTIFADLAQDKQERTEFVTEVTKFLQTAGTLGAQMPEAIPLLGKLLQFGARGHRVGRDLESAIEEFCDEAAHAGVARIKAQQQQPNPDMLKAQADMLRATSEDKKNQATVEATNLQTASDERQAQMELAGQAQENQAEVTRQQMEGESEMRNAAIDYQSNQLDLDMYEIDKEIKLLEQDMAEDQAKAEREQMNRQMLLDKKKGEMQLKIEAMKMKREKAKPMPARPAKK